MKKNVCIIPARGGSKRIKNKNLKKIKNKSFLAHAIDKAKQSKIFDKIIVSTDSKKIKLEGQKYGAICNTFRPDKLSNNFATILDVIKFEFKNNKLNNYDFVFCIYPCSGPQIQIRYLKEALKIIKKNKADHLLTTTEFEYPPEKAMIQHNKYLSLKNKKHYRTRTQDLPKQFKDTGSIYIFSNKILNSNKKVENWRITNLNLNKYSIIDIDDYNDYNFLRKLLD